MICPYCFESMDGLKKIYDTLVLLYVIKLFWLGIKCPIKVKFDLWSYKGLIYMDGVIYLFVICHWVAIWVMVQLTNLYCIMWPKFFMNHKWQIQSHLVLLCVSIEITILIGYVATKVAQSWLIADFFHWIPSVITVYSIMDDSIEVAGSD